MDMYWVNATLNAVWAFLMQKPLLMGGLILSVFLGLRFLSPFFEQVRYERAQLVAADSKLIAELLKPAEPINAVAPQTEGKMDMSSVKTGDVNVSENNGPTQISIGSPGSQQVINQRRTINPQAKIKKTQRDGNHVLQIILSQTGGFWDPGTVFQINTKMSGAYSRARIIQGLPPAQFDVRIGEHKEKGEYSYSTATAPFPDSPIVLEIISAQDINLVQLGVAPLATK